MNITKSVFCVNKPIGWTSNDVVQFIKHKYKFKKVGHAGTLDPNATGVLVIGVNEGTKQLGKLILDDKTYIAEIQLGILTDCGDITGKVIITQRVEEFTNNQIKEAIDYFVKNQYLQTPPLYSAIKINGRKAYEYARNNEKVDIQPRKVRINKINSFSYDSKTKVIKIDLNVSKGFYIRSFAIDLAKQLKQIATLKSLIRTSSGEFKLSNAINIDFDHK